jgi:hypothetical protein
MASSELVVRVRRRSRRNMPKHDLLDRVRSDGPKAHDDEFVARYVEVHVGEPGSRKARQRVHSAPVWRRLSARARHHLYLGVGLAGRDDGKGFAVNADRSRSIGLEWFVT